MSEREETLVKIIIWLIMGLPIMVIALLPTWFVIFGNWSGYLYWIPWTIALSGYVYKLCIILLPLFGVWKKQSHLLLLTPYMVILGIWGMPVLKTKLIRLASMPLSGLELQRVILTIIIIKGLTISAGLSAKKGREIDDSSLS